MNTFWSSLDLRSAYKALVFLKKIKSERKNDENYKRLLNDIIDVKKHIRSFHRKPNPTGRVIKSDYDRVLALITLPDYIESEGEAKEYFKKYEYMERPHSIYDCTGEWFTCWYKVFERNGKWMAYHCIAADV